MEARLHMADGRQKTIILPDADSAKKAASLQFVSNLIFCATNNVTLPLRLLSDYASSGLSKDKALGMSRKNIACVSNKDFTQQLKQAKSAIAIHVNEEHDEGDKFYDLAYVEPSALVRFLIFEKKVIF